MQRTIINGYAVAILVTLAAGACHYWLQPIYGERAATIAMLLVVALAGALTSIWMSRLRQQTARAHRAQAETEGRLAATEKLHQLSSALSRATTPADVIATCLPELMHAVEAVAGAAFTISDDGTACELAQKVGYPQLRPGSAIPYPIAASSPLYEAIRRRELMVLAADTHHGVEHTTASVETIPELHAGDIVLPLASGSGATAVVVLNRPAGRTLDGEQREFLLSAARHTAQALTRARLYETAERGRAEAEALRLHADGALHELQKAEEALRLSEARYRTLAARTNRLYGLSAGLSKALTLEALGAVIVRHGKVVAGAAAGSAALLTDGGQQFEVLYGEEYGGEPEAPRRFALSEGLCSTAAVETKRPVFVGSFTEWQEKYPASAAIAADGGYVSSATLPLLADSSVIGVVTFHFTVPVNFDEEYTALLTSVAQHCAQALDRARMYEAAEHARAEAEQANRSKDDFLSTISHELRTPLNAILGWAAMLRSGVVDPSRVQRAIEAIFNNASRQGRLIEELLDVSRIVAGRASIDLQNVDLGENIRGAVEAIMPLAAAKGVELQFEPQQSGISVTADPRRLEQIFLNLLSNAVKFTPRDGRITVNMTLSGRAAEVRVLDTGIGIEQGFLPHVFERFRQADSTATRAVGGLGLGLFISRQLVEAQGGRLEAESAGQGTGSTFIVTLPAVETTPTRWTADIPVETRATRNEAMPALDGLSVLVVDDEPDAREVMAAALHACGASVLSASSSREALATLESTHVDLLLSDIAMPGEDGCELIRTIRAMPSMQLATIPAAAVTAHARDDERERALAAGFHMHLSKPVHPIALAKAVAALALSRTV